MTKSRPCACRDLAMGKILHTVQDSCSESHVAREGGTGRILFFQNYSHQDEVEHGKADKGPDWLKIPGVSEAIDASTHLLEMRKRGADFSEVEKYLRETVYNFAPGRADAPTGGSVERFEKKE